MYTTNLHKNIKKIKKLPKYRLENYRRQFFAVLIEAGNTVTRR